MYPSREMCEVCHAAGPDHFPWNQNARTHQRMDPISDSIAGRGRDPTSERTLPSKRKSSAPVSPVRPFGRRVRSWLRMNAGGAPNTCKSNGTPLRGEASGERLSNAWRTCPPLGDSRGKPRVIPGGPAGAHAPAGIAQAVGDGSATHQVDGGATAHRADDG